MVEEQKAEEKAQVTEPEPEPEAPTLEGGAEVAETEQVNKPISEAGTLVEVKSLSQGDTFVWQDEKYKFDGLAGDEANIILLTTVQIKVTSRKTKDHTYGIARLEIPADTLVQKL